MLDAKRVPLVVMLALGPQKSAVDFKCEGTPFSPMTVDAS